MIEVNEEIISVREHFYILSTSPRIDDRTRVLKHGDTFAIFDRFGDIEGYGTGELGIYHKDTRFVSRLSLKVGSERPFLLSSSIKDDNALLAIDATNPDITRNSAVEVPHGTVHIFRSQLLWNQTCYGRIRIRNYGLHGVRLSFSLEFGADFADVFEVRGARRTRRGQQLVEQVQADKIIYAYEGLDRRLRRTRIAFDRVPAVLTDGEARYEVNLGPGDEEVFGYAIACEVAAPADTVAPPQRLSLGYEEVSRQAAAALRSARADWADIFTSNEQFNDWLNRSLADLNMMRTDTRHGAYPYAGVPWFCTAFGRDGIITALECLSFNTAFARGVLAYLAATQAETENVHQDAEPGKVLHEVRDGEMAVVGEVPFHRYYGSVDATPLFVVLAGAYYERTGEMEFLRSLWPHILRALDWIDRYGDRDGDGFVEYARRSQQGLTNQGWKDSEDSVFHADGSLAQGPIALCEVQGYVYAAKRAAAGLAAALGDEDRARILAEEAEALRDRFESTFWCEEISTYALALDGHKRLCRVRTSNAGHCLYAGIATDEHARRVAATLTSEASFSGWGVRTAAAGEARYNPMSYHNGSVWPHDNALIAAGFARYGLKDQAARILTGLFDATLFLDLHRLPELFCGFPRRHGEAPTLYPVACSPQAWASAAVFLLLESCLGLKVQGSQRRVVFSRPVLPESLMQVSIKGLRVGEASIDVEAIRHDEGDVGINVIRRQGDLEVLIQK
ncbi:MAG TPA: amylo-alpha-1,6-glucosidase [Gemmatimonadales bacterium]|nr:amylo-alpha-1,6-glucosidase [Gemmatimonadales bacterium]